MVASGWKGAYVEGRVVMAALRILMWMYHFPLEHLVDQLQSSVGALAI